MELQNSLPRPNSSESTSHPKLALRLVLNLQLQQLHFCTSFYFIFYFILLYFLCKVVFIVTPGSIARSLTILSLVRRLGQKCLLNDDVNVNVNPSSKTFLSYRPPCAMTQISH